MGECSCDNCWSCARHGKPPPPRVRSYVYTLDGRVRAACSCGWVSRLTRDIGRATERYAEHTCTTTGGAP